MAIDRRTFLVSAAVAFASASKSMEAAAESLWPRYLAAARLPDGRHALVIVNTDGRIECELPLDARGHDAAISPDGRLAVAFARRPGTFAVTLDLIKKRTIGIFETPDDRHFYGHGVFSADGRLLYATENDFDNARGVLGIYDVGAGFRRIGEFPTHGVGPHDVLLMNDERTLCVANGGIETHPESGRAKLNLDAMRPSLVFIDRTTGDLLATHELSRDLRALSIRHICADASGAVWFGGQWEGALEEAPELIGRASLDVPVRLIAPSQPLGAALKGYIGAVATSGNGRIIAATAPRAGRALYFDAETEDVVGETLTPDCCGVAPADGNGVAVSSGIGELRIERAGDDPVIVSVGAGLAFDNHLRRLVV